MALKHFLSAKERNRLKLLHKQERDKRVCDRIKAVLLYDSGWTLSKISEVVLLNEQTISNDINEYRKDRQLSPHSGGSAEKLSPKQLRKLFSHLKTHTYPYTKDIIAFVRSTFGVSYTVAGIRNLLERHGFYYHKPHFPCGETDRHHKKAWFYRDEREAA